MIVECGTVALLIFVMSYCYLRTGKQSFAVAITPLAFVPIIHIVGEGLGLYIGDLLSISPVLTWAFLDILAAIIAVVLFSLTAFKMKDRAHRISFLIMCVGFTFAFSWVLLVDIISPYLRFS